MTRFLLGLDSVLCPSLLDLDSFGSNWFRTGSDARRLDTFDSVGLRPEGQDQIGVVYCDLKCKQKSIRL